MRSPENISTRLDYSKISYEDTLSQISNIINMQNPRIQDFFSTSTGRMLYEVFAAYAELLYIGIESGLVESYSSLAKRMSSIVIDAHSKGYSIRRPVPARSSFYVVLEGTISHYSGEFTIRNKSNFMVNGHSFISVGDHIFKWDASGKVIAPEQGAMIVQGVLRTVSFTAVEGKIFQKFEIADTTFSEYYGDSDPTSDQPLENRITVVKVDGVPWEIDRKSLYSSDKSTAPSIKDGKLIKSKNNKCVITTNSDGTIDVLFGDGIISAIPSGLVEVTYLSTSGVAGNLYNSKDLKIETVSVTLDAVPVRSISLEHISFYLNESVAGGSDIESIDSIRYNSPKIFSALDRAITVDDYEAILLTSPNVSHALAFGEDQLGPGDYRYFNVVMFTVINSLYTGESGSLRPATPYEYILSGFNTLMAAQRIQDSGTTTNAVKSTFDSKFKLSSIENDLSEQATYEQYVTSLGSIFRLTRQNIDSSSELGYIMGVLRRKGQATVRHIYFPPKVHRYRANIRIYVTQISNKNSIASNVYQKTLEYLKDNTRFNFPIYSSKIIKIIESLPSIVGCHVDFVPIAELPTDSKYLDLLLAQSNSVLDDLFSSMSELQSRRPEVVLFPAFTESKILMSTILVMRIFKILGYHGSRLMNDSSFKESNISNIINYVWENTVGRIILNPMIVDGRVKSISDFMNLEFNESIPNGGLRNSNFNELIYDTFIRWAVQFRNDTDYYTAKYAVSNSGDISNFTQPNEIAQISIDKINDITILTASR